MDEINYDAKNDRLWFVGDLVNRGPESLACLRQVIALGDNAETVLGNHDLHLLAVAGRIRKAHKKDTLDELLNAEDVEALLTWIRRQPLLVTDTELNISMVHAGLLPQWSLQQAIELAKETEHILTAENYINFLNSMYGDAPDSWSDTLTGNDRYRFIINCFTRIRYVDQTGKLNLNEKGIPGTQPDNLRPWYQSKDRKTRQNKIIFGHWSTVTLGPETDFKQYNVYPLDTGCVWGRKLTALRLEDEVYFSVPALQAKRFS